MTNLLASELLRRWVAGEADALGQLMPLVYEELHRIASRHLRTERADHTLQTTALINEAYLRLMEGEALPADNHAHFVAMTSNLMRQILVDHARHRLAKKRQGGVRITLSEDLSSPDIEVVEVLSVDAALSRLALLDEQQARVVELRFFGGLSIAETSIALGVSVATVKREWATARAWLQRDMAQTCRP